MKTVFTIGSCSERHDGDMADDLALRAHVLRRLTLGPRPWQAADLDGTSPADLVEQLLAAEPLQPDEPALGGDDDYGRVIEWWLDVMLDERTGLHERMVWFWHTHLTTSMDKASPLLMYRQNLLLRAHALGNFRTLLQEIAVDPAMLFWLDGVGSVAGSPNENFSREVMELFALGRWGGYTETDVANGAVAFSGWWVDGDNDDVAVFDPGSGPQGPVEFLGRSVASASEAIDAICDHPSCPPWIAGNLHEHLTGVWPDDERLGELAAVFADAGLEIRPLVAAIVRHPSFLELRLNRPRTGLEWYLAVRRLFDVGLDWWPLDGLGQVPFLPPNVAGWRGQARWMSVGTELAKAQLSWDHTWETATLDENDPVGDLLGRACLHEVSQSTLDVLYEAAAVTDNRRDRASLLHALVAVSPEFSVA